LKADLVRRAESEDAAAVARLICAFRDYYEEREPDDAVVLATVRLLLEDPATEFLLAGDPPRGFAQLRFRASVWTGADDAWLEDLYVDEDARGRGLGRALTEACIERARQRGCKRIQLDANERNDAAIALYEKAGFRAGRAERWDGARDLYFTRRLT
jgi:ribosomal protein S18 acetylase RimI-like enzyme